MPQLTKNDFASVARRSLEVAPPIAGNTIMVAPTSTSAATAIPASFFNSFVTMESDGGTAYVLFGASDVVVSETATTGNTVGAKLAPDAPKQFFIAASDGSTHFALKAPSGSPKVRIWKSSR